MNFIGCKPANKGWNILWFVTQEGTSTMKLSKIQMVHVKFEIIRI